MKRKTKKIKPATDITLKLLDRLQKTNETLRRILDADLGRGLIIEVEVVMEYNKRVIKEALK